MTIDEAQNTSQPKCSNMVGFLGTSCKLTSDNGKEEERNGRFSVSPAPPDEGSSRKEHSQLILACRFGQEMLRFYLLLFLISKYLLVDSGKSSFNSVSNEELHKYHREIWI